MADESREVTITIRGKNLTQAEFAAARKDLAGLGAEGKNASTSTTALGQAFKALGPAIGVAAISGAAMKVLDYAGKINDLAAQTGLSTRAIQEMSHAAKMTGTSLDSFTNAAFKLGTNLAGGGASVVGAVEKLGLSYDNLKKQSPDQQFNTITTALGGVQSAQERNKLAVELFGKAAKEILPAIAQGYADLADGALVAGDDQLQALDMAGDALDSFYEGVLSVGTQLAGGFIIAVREANREIFSQLSMVKAVREGFAAWGDVLDTFGVTAVQLPKVFNAAKVAAGNMPAPIKAVSMSLEEQERVTKSLDKQILASIETKKAFAKTEKEAENAAKAFAASVQRLDTAEWFVGFKAPVQELSRELEELPSSAAIAMNGLARFKDAVKATGTATEGLGASIKASLLDVLSTVPATLARAFEGGGNMLGAVKSIGSQLGSALGETIGSSFESLGRLGGPLGSAIGSLVGPLIGKIAGLFSSKNTAEVKAYNAEISKVRDTLLETYGPLDQLEAKAQSVGLSFKDAWGHQGKAGLEAMNTLAAEFKQRWDGLNEGLATSRTELDGLIKQAADLGYEFDQNGKLVNVSVEKMRETAQKFGLDVKALGPSFDQAGLRTRIDEVINGFTLMDKGGTSTGTILSGMKDEINAIVNDSIKFGVDIPANMKPWIENLVETGQLTDENGQKMTDLTGLKFGEPVASEFEKISARIGTLIDAIATLVERIQTTITPAIDNATRDRTVRIGFAVDDPPEINVGGGRDGRNGGYASGTYGVHGIDFPDFGSGTRTVLHGREAVVREVDKIPTAARWLAAAGLAGVMAGSPSAPAVNVYVAMDTSGNARQVSEAEFRQIQDRLNGGGLTVPVRAISQRGR